MQSQPGDINAYLADQNYNLGSEYLKIGNYLKAYESLLSSLDANPNNAHAWIKMGIACQNLGRYNEAITANNNAQAVISGNPIKAFIYKEAIELFNQGVDSYDAGDLEGAIAFCQKALDIDPNYVHALNGLGVTLNGLGRYDDAIAFCQKALDIDPNYVHALNGLGATLDRLGRYDDAIRSFQKALDIDPNCVPALNGLGATLYRLGRYDDAIRSFQKALDIDPNCVPALNGLGNALYRLGRYEDAIAFYQKALDIDPNCVPAFNGLGNALSDLGCYDDAIRSFQKALEIDPNFHLALNGLGATLSDLGRYEAAIPSFQKALEITHDQFWQAWANRGWAFFYSRGYQRAIQNWDEGLEKYLPSNYDYRLACGQLHKEKGKAHYKYGKRQAVRSQYFDKAKDSYLQACEYLTNPLIPEVYLEVLQGLIIVCRSLGDAKTNEYLTTATTLLEQLLLDSQTDPLKKQLLSRKFAGLYQLEVDNLVQSGDKVQAIEKAEERKNFCLKWMEKGWQTQVDRATFPQMQELLNGDFKKAIIYWHLSPVTLTTFIIRYQQDIDTVITHFDKSLLENEITLEKLLDNWKTDYQDYRKSEGKKRETTPQNNLWRDNMIANLEKLQTLLNIPNICDKYLSNVSELILIPHRELHLLPLESLFLSHPDRAFLITRLPSAKIGLKLNQENPHPSSLSPLPNLLSIEDPDTKQPMLFAEIESAAICQLSAKPERIWGASATQEKVKNALKIPQDIFHFTGHGYHLTQSPLESALKLADKPLTLGDIFQLDLRQYHLVFLSACETGITGKEGLTDEFVGLVSGFLAVGATYVISTLWAVKDYSTAWLVINFYQRLDQGIAPAEALKQAQNWLRTVTHSKLAQWLGSLALELAKFAPGCAESLEDFADAQKEIAIMENDNPPYADPYFWAGFTITGKVN
jgi:tetratricopeptide (TPR) repeat protein